MKLTTERLERLRLQENLYKILPRGLRPILTVPELTLLLHDTPGDNLGTKQVSNALIAMSKQDPHVHNSAGGWKLLPEDAVKPQN